MTRGGLVCAALLLLAACGGNGAPQYAGPPSQPAATFGECALCHATMASNMLLGGAELKCQTCHADATPGRVGPGHRTIPGSDQVPSFPGPSHALGAQVPFGKCAYCHNTTAVDLSPVSGQINCQTCHFDVTPGLYGPGHQTRPTTSQVPNPPASPHRPGAEAAFGVCAYCHNDKALNILPVQTDLQCQTCHDDTASGAFGPGHQTLPGPSRVPDPPAAAHQPGPELAFGACSFCHNDNAVGVEPVQTQLQCQTCHSDSGSGGYGPGHQSRPSTSQVPDPPVAAHVPGSEAVFGACAYCHNQNAIDVEPVQADLRCATCHDATSATGFGPGHQSLPTTSRVPDPPVAAHKPGPEGVFQPCAYCHNTFTRNMVPVSNDLQCAVCHSDAQPGRYGPDHRQLPPEDLVPSFIGPSHALAEQSRFGSCGFCHADLGSNVLASGDMQLVCVTCHTTQIQPTFGPDHRSIPGPDLVPSFVGPTHLLGPEAKYGNCGFCHNSVTDQALTHTHGSIAVECLTCHADQQPDSFGPMHRQIALCSDCHGTQRRTHHDPAAGTRFECSSCHDPHGSANLLLIRELILLPSGTRRPVTFTNLMGLGDGGLASVSMPGSGLCETCHTTTRYFRGDGSGAVHFPYPCFTCHPHDLGFSPSP